MLKICIIIKSGLFISNSKDQMDHADYCGSPEDPEPNLYCHPSKQQVNWHIVPDDAVHPLKFCSDLYEWAKIREAVGRASERICVLSGERFSWQCIWNHVKAKDKRIHQRQYKNRLISTCGLITYSFAYSLVVENISLDYGLCGWTRYNYL